MESQFQNVSMFTMFTMFTMLLNVSGPNNLCSGKLKAVGNFRGRIKPTALIIIIIVMIMVIIMVIRKTLISGDILDLEISPRHHCYTCLIKLFVILIVNKIKSNNDHLDAEMSKKGPNLRKLSKFHVDVSVGGP